MHKAPNYDHICYLAPRQCVQGSVVRCSESHHICTRLLLKAGCAPYLAGCRWDKNCTKWVENLIFDVILMAFWSVFRPETWRTWFFHQKTLSGGQERQLLRKMCYLTKTHPLCFIFPALQGPGPGPYGPIWGSLEGFPAPFLTKSGDLLFRLINLINSIILISLFNYDH